MFNHFNLLLHWCGFFGCSGLHISLNPVGMCLLFAVRALLLLFYFFYPYGACDESFTAVCSG